MSASVSPVTTMTGHEISMSARVRPEVASPRSSAGKRVLAQELGRAERVDEEAVGDLARDLGHLGADPGEEDPRGAELARLRA